MAATQHLTLDTLRKQVAAMETGGKTDAEGAISCGVPVLDAMLPAGGFLPGTIVEWVEQEGASGAGWLSLLAARQALVPSNPLSQNSLPHNSLPHNGRLVVIDGDGSFYPPAAAAAGIPLDRLLVVRPAGRADGLWAADQALRSPAVSVVWGMLRTIDDREARRLQLAAETGKTLGLWLRPSQALGEPSWADVRWFVRGKTHHEMADHAIADHEMADHAMALGVMGQHENGLHGNALNGAAINGAGRRLEARLVRCRGGRSGASVTLEIDSSGRVHHVPSERKTAAMPLVAQLAHPAIARSGNEQHSAPARKRLA